MQIHEARLREQEAELQKREQKLQRSEQEFQAYKDRERARLADLQLDLCEKERILNQILKHYNFPETQGELRKYLDSCHESTRGDSGNKTDSKFSSLSPMLGSCDTSAKRPPKTLPSSVPQSMDKPTCSKVTQLLTSESSPIEMLKKFKMQKQEAANQSKKPADDDFRQTVFNPNQTVDKRQLSSRNSLSKPVQDALKTYDT